MWLLLSALARILIVVKVGLGWRLTFRSARWASRLAYLRPYQRAECEVAIVVLYAMELKVAGPHGLVHLVER